MFLCLNMYRSLESYTQNLMALSWYVLYIFTCILDDFLKVCVCGYESNANI